MPQSHITEFEVARYQIDSIGRRRALERRKSYYALEVLPSYGKRGGTMWADDFARLSKHEQRAIIYRMVTARSRCAARRAGRPDPIWVEATVKPLEGGGYVLVDTKPLRPEYGGDGRTPENTRHEQPRVTDTPQLRLAVEKLKAKFAAMGIEIVYEDPSHKPDPVPERKAATR
jgi:hypothetical protein